MVSDDFAIKVDWEIEDIAAVELRIFLFFYFWLKKNVKIKVTWSESICENLR